MNKVEEVLRRERAELARPKGLPADSIAAPEEISDRRRRIGDIDALLREFEQA